MKHSYTANSLMDITGVTSLTESQKTTLKALEAVEFEGSVAETNLVYMRQKRGRIGRGAG